MINLAIEVGRQITVTTICSTSLHYYETHQLFSSNISSNISNVGRQIPQTSTTVFVLHNKMINLTV